MRPICRTILPALLLVCGAQAALAQAEPVYDLRDITVGMPVTAIPDAGYVNLACAGDPQRKLTKWSDWRDCAADADGLRAVHFEFDPQTSREGTLVAGHPVTLTLRIDDAGRVAGLNIDTDAKARLYMRKKAFLLGIQVKSRYGDDGWTCAELQPQAGEGPVGGVYVRESCKKLLRNRAVVVERELFRRLDQAPKDFVDQTRVSITRETK
ncbi:MAG: hypothetical protein JOY90_38245 [Bradyrhizobium sp.]|uniref:hypothetical protein n=1 Tax=Bradyrhizobium sp. TaxID=376 RepID=UPI001DF2C9F4|nr:hypothetical protein [Bradyrhizobium sp.]MBV9566247.1 hypothetical protein [Bradyrhizobium sp.]